ncbi:MAG: hypothetical protein ACQCN6_12970 [Candidatus Bathyarchaeia archaeon]|jgi:hypothetical protein
MTQITIEYMIMIPVLILQIFLFPFVASVIMENWNDTHRALELQETAGHLASTVQQLYYTINHASIVNGTVKVNLDVPQTIDNYAYTATLSHVTQVDSSYEIMNVTLRFISVKGVCSTLVTLGGNVDWENNLTFSSIDDNLGLTAEKTAGDIVLTFGGA